MKKIICIISFSILFGCGSKNTEGETIKDISVNDTLVAKTVKIATNMLMPTRIFNTENKLVVYDQIKDEMFKVFNLPEIEYQYSFGHTGKGPDEFSFIDANTMKMMGDNLLFLDFNTVKSLEINDKKIKVINSKTLRIEKSPINGLQMVNDSIYIYNLMSVKKNGAEHQMVNINSKKTIKEFGAYPDTDIKYNNEFEQYNAFYKHSVSNPTNNKFAVFYSYFNKIKIYSKTGELLHEINIEDNYPEYSPKDIKKNILFRVNPIPTSDFIYVLRIDQSKNEVENNFATFKPKIEVWNWEGKLLAKYLLDKPITAFTISEKENKLYAVSYIGTNEIYEYELPKPSNIVNTQKSNFKQVNNDFYTINIPKGWIYSDATPENEKNKLTEVNNRIYNTNIFVNPQRKDRCGSSIWISIISNPNKKDFLVSDFLKLNDFSKEDNYKFKEMKINGKLISVTSFQRTDSYPNGGKYTSNTAFWTWKEGKNIVEIQSSSCTENKELIEYVINSISSFSLK